MNKVEELEGILLSIASKVVDSPQSLIIISEEKESKILFVLSTKCKGEIGQLIGEKGNIANSFRVLLRAASKRIQSKEVALVVTPEIETEF